VQPRPQLPAAARGGFAKSIDWMFTAFVMFSFMTHFGFVVYLENSDWPVAQGIGVIPPEYIALVTTTMPPEEPEEPAPTTDEGEKPEPEKPSKQPEKAPEKQPDEGKAAGPDQAAKEAANAEKAAAIATEAASAAEALLLGALGADSGGALQDVLAGGAVTGNAEEVLSQAAGVGVATNAGGILRPRSGGGTGDRVGGLGSLGASGAGGKEVQGGGALSERAPAGRINLEGGEDIGGSGEFDAKLVTAEVKKRLRAIQICYEQQLRRNPGLQGKVVVEFTIEQSGTVSKATATANTTNDPAVASCVVDTVKRFRFNPGPEGGSVTYSYPFVFAPQN
jgi:TonB family protein